jgi:hypothetical protein
MVSAPSPRLPSQYYTSEDADVLYHPVVIPLEEFLTTRRPVALTPEQLARQRAAAAARATPPQPATPRATTLESDPFTDDTADAGEAASAVGQPAATPEFPATPEQPEPEAETQPEAEAPPDSEPAEMEDDPFNIPE